MLRRVTPVSLAPLALVRLLPLVACDESDEEFDAELAEQLENNDEFRAQWDALFDHVEFVQDDSQLARATGSVQGPFRDSGGSPRFVQGHPLRWTCGITFISPHYGVTAAHCVDEVPDPAIHKVTVEQYDISDASVFALWVASYVEGTFPNIARPTKVEEFSTYDVDRYECTVVSRCAFGSLSCDFSADIALVRCPDRPSSAAWVPVAPSDPTTGPVEMYWAHEVLMIPSSPPSESDALNRYEHYTEYTDKESNHHYFGGDANALLPLRSVDWPSDQGGGPRTRLGGSDSIGATISTDLFACHGTSGSGVFQRNTSGNPEYLGPVATGGSWAFDRLCDNPETTQPGATGLRYTSSASTRQLQWENFWTLWIDRSPAVAKVNLAPVHFP